MIIIITKEAIWIIRIILGPWTWICPGIVFAQAPALHCSEPRSEIRRLCRISNVIATHRDKQYKREILGLSKYICPNKEAKHRKLMDSFPTGQKALRIVSAGTKTIPIHRHLHSDLIQRSLTKTHLRSILNLSNNLILRIQINNVRSFPPELQFASISESVSIYTSPFISKITRKMFPNSSHRVERHPHSVKNFRTIINFHNLHYFYVTFLLFETDCVLQCYTLLHRSFTFSCTISIRFYRLLSILHFPTSVRIYVPCWGELYVLNHVSRI